MSIAIECKNGIQIEVIVRKHSEVDERFTHEAKLSDKDEKQLIKAIQKAVDEPASA